VRCAHWCTVVMVLYEILFKKNLIMLYAVVGNEYQIELYLGSGVSGEGVDFGAYFVMCESGAPRGRPFFFLVLNFIIFYFFVTLLRL
jgi:hypothetical protein